MKRGLEKQEWTSCLELKTIIILFNIYIYIIILYLIINSIR